GRVGGTAPAHDAQRIVEALRKVVLGQEAATLEVLVCLLARGHILLEGVPGTAKTLLVRTLALALDVRFVRIQFTPDLMPADITGITLLTGAQQFSFRPGPVFADLVLADEINRAPAKTQAALLEAMQERTVTVDGQSHPLSSTFTVFATQNPIEFEGTYPLPEAELDRFMAKVQIGYPAADVEQGILTRYVEGFEADRTDTYGVSPVINADGLEQLRQAVDRVRVEPSITAYVTAIVRATPAAAVAGWRRHRRLHRAVVRVGHRRGDPVDAACARDRGNPGGARRGGVLDAVGPRRDAARRRAPDRADLAGRDARTNRRGEPGTATCALRASHGRGRLPLDQSLLAPRAPERARSPSRYPGRHPATTRAGHPAARRGARTGTGGSVAARPGDRRSRWLRRRQL